MTKYEGKIVIPDAYEYFAKKFPCTGMVIAKGAKTKLDVQVSDRVSYERMGVQRFQWAGEDLCACRESSLIVVGVLHQAIN